MHDEALVVKNVENVLFGRIVEELTKPRAGDDRIALGAVRRANEIVFEGTFEEINDYFRAQVWSDELPIVPPTLERVEAFLKHTNARRTNASPCSRRPTSHATPGTSPPTG